MLCDYDRNTLACRACGHVAKRLPTFRDCTATRIRIRRIAVGSAVESLLTRAGITKDRVAKWLSLKDCGCEMRKNWLDSFGYEQQEKLERLLNKAARLYFGD